MRPLILSLGMSPAGVQPNGRVSGANARVSTKKNIRAQKMIVRSGLGCVSQRLQARWHLRAMTGVQIL
jgi:hypothetical protein